MSIITKIKEYIEYKKKVKKMKINIINTCTNISIFGNNLSTNLNKYITYVNDIIDSYNNTEDKNEIIQYTIDSVANIFNTNSGRIMEFFTWVMSVNQNDLTKLVKLYEVSKTTDILNKLKEKENAENNE